MREKEEKMRVHARTSGEQDDCAENYERMGTARVKAAQERIYSRA